MGMACASEHSLMDDIETGDGREAYRILGKAAAAVFGCIARARWRSETEVTLVVAITITQQFWLTFGLVMLREFIDYILSHPKSVESRYSVPCLREALKPTTLP